MYSYHLFSDTMSIHKYKAPSQAVVMDSGNHHSKYIIYSGNFQNLTEITCIYLQLLSIDIKF